jgi:hypothetical protein
MTGSIVCLCAACFTEVADEPVYWSHDTRPAHQTAAAPAPAATSGVPVVATPATVNAAFGVPQPPQAAPVIQSAAPSGGAIATTGVIGRVGQWNNQTAVIIDQITYVCRHLLWLASGHLCARE